MQKRLGTVKSTTELPSPAAARLTLALRRSRPITRKARKVDAEDNGWLYQRGGPPGPVLTLLRSLPPVTGLGVGFAGEFSREVGQFISVAAEKGEVVPERFGCCHGSGARRDRKLRAARFWPNLFARRCEDPVGCPYGYPWWSDARRFLC